MLRGLRVGLRDRDLDLDNLRRSGLRSPESGASKLSTSNIRLFAEELVEEEEELFPTEVESPIEEVDRPFLTGDDLRGIG